jgi:hypothetical protein
MAGKSQDADTLARWLAERLWRSQSDLLWGFNHLVLTRRAAKLQQLCTSLGILQPAVLGFGVHGGPAACLTCVDKIFESMEEVKAFIDDLLVATGVSGSLADPVDPLALRPSELSTSTLRCWSGS